MNTEGPLFNYYMFICASFGSKISGFQHILGTLFLNLNTIILGHGLQNYQAHGKTLNKSRRSDQDMVLTF